MILFNCDGAPALIIRRRKTSLAGVATRSGAGPETNREGCQFAKQVSKLVKKDKKCILLQVHISKFRPPRFFLTFAKLLIFPSANWEEKSFYFFCCNVR